MSRLPDAINCSPTKDFTQIPNAILRNPNLSFKAKGIICLLFSNKNGWVSYKEVLSKLSTDGSGSIQTGLDELKKYGYFCSLRYVDKTTKANKGSLWAYTDTSFRFDLTSHINILEVNNLEIWNGSIRRLNHDYNSYLSKKQELEKQEVENQVLAFQVLENPPLIIPNIKNTNLKENQEKIIGNVPAEQLPNEIEKHPSKDLKKQTLQRKAKKVLTRLNELSSKPRGFRLVETNFKYIIARLDEGFSVMDCFHVLETKIHDPYFKENPGFYNPETLFRPKNFEKYLNQDIKEFKKQNKGPSNGSGLSGKIEYKKGSTIKVNY